jgi:hypothetical protein
MELVLEIGWAADFGVPCLLGRIGSEPVSTGCMGAFKLVVVVDLDTPFDAVPLQIH